MSLAESEIFEAKRSEADYELVWAKLSQMAFESLKEAHRYSYMLGRGAGKADAMRRQVAESYKGAINTKEKINGNSSIRIQTEG